VSASFAGGYSEPEVVAVPVVVEEGSSSSLGGSTALLLLGAVALAVALSND
jgi:hypothetical protein